MTAEMEKVAELCAILLSAQILLAVAERSSITDWSFLPGSPSVLTTDENGGYEHSSWNVEHRAWGISPCFFIDID
jgi:hypothetical protein